MENPRVYVSNLAYSVHWQDLKDFARQAGTVVRADVLSSHDGRSRGCGIVEFESAADAQRAIETLNNIELNGRPVFVREDREPAHASAPANASRASAPDTVVFVSNLPFSTSWQDLKDLARPYGHVLRADVHQTRQGRSRGHGTLVFETAAEAAAAIAALDQTEISGRNIEVRLDRGPPTARKQSVSQVQQADPFLTASGKGEPSDIVHASNLPWRTTNDDLIELFQSIAPVTRASIQLLPDGRPAGTGVIQFETPEGAQTAVAQLTGYVYGDLKLVVTFARYPPGVDPRAAPVSS